MYGRPMYAAENARLNDALQQQTPLVAAHRGTGLGSIAENTQSAVAAAVRQGAHMVEFDVMRSTDGEFFLFHDGYEPLHFGFDEELRTLTADRIRELRYGWNSDEPYGVTPLGEVLNSNPETMFNVDRSWWYWDTLLPYLDDFPIDGRVLLKCPPEREWLDVLGAHTVKYPLAPMVQTHQEVLDILERDDVNLVGFELLARHVDHEFGRREYIDWIHSQGLLVFANGLTMRNRKPMFCGWDDETSVLEGPEHGWDKLVDMGVDVIQTDWPGLLAQRVHERSVKSVW